MRLILATVAICALLLAQASATTPTYYGDTITATLPQYNVLYYGAKCNNSTDDAAAIQSAINAAETAVTGGSVKGGVVYIPGICDVGTTLSITKNNIYLLGNGGAENDGSPLAASSSALKWIGASSGTLVQWKAGATCSAYCNIEGGGASRLSFISNNGLAAIGIAAYSLEGARFSQIAGDMFTEAFIETYYGTGSTAAPVMHDRFDQIYWFNNVNSGGGIWLKGGEYNHINDFLAAFHGGYAVHLGSSSTDSNSGDTSDFDEVVGLMAINEASGTGGAVTFDCGSFSNEVHFLSGYGTFVSNGSGTCTGTLGPAGVPGANQLIHTDHCDSNEVQPSPAAGSYLVQHDDCGNSFLDGYGAPGHTEAYNYIEFGSSDIPALFVGGGSGWTYHPTIFIGKSNTSNRAAMLIGNPNGSNDYTQMGTDSALTCGSVIGKTFLVISKVENKGLCVDGAGNTEASGYIAGVNHNACSATSGVPCETTATCSISAATTCNGTATVPTTSVCTATANASDTTTGTESWKLSLSTNTLTATANVSSSQTSTAAANVTCL